MFGDMKILLHFLLFLDIEMAKVVEIIPRKGR